MGISFFWTLCEFLYRYYTEIDMLVAWIFSIVSVAQDTKKK